MALCRAILEHLDRLGVPGEVRDRNGPVRKDEVEIRVEIEVRPCGAPAGEGVPEGGREACPNIREGRACERRGLAEIDGVALPARVADEEVGAAVARVVGSRDSHAGVGIRNSCARSPLLEAKAEPRRVRLRASGPGDVLVEPVRIAVVGDVQVRAPVAVEVREDGAEAVIEASSFEPGVNSDLAEA